MEEQIVVPAFLRAARTTYSAEIRERLAEIGCEDFPRNGPYLVGGMVNHHNPPAQLIREMGISKQAASQLVDTLVLRGYVTRGVDPEDRRRMTIEVTERGEAAAAAVRAGIAEVDAALARRLTPDQLAGFHAGLVALTTLRECLPSDSTA
jgi:DNA-binding MarR family transcriptional regulator